MWTKGKWVYKQSTKTIRSKRENFWIATMDSFDGAIDNDANARRICQCVNNFDDLLQAAKKILYRLKDDSMVRVALESIGQLGMHKPLYRELEQAIQNAEKGDRDYYDN